MGLFEAMFKRMRQNGNARTISDWYVEYLVIKEYTTSQEYLEWMGRTVPQDEEIIRIFAKYQGKPEAFKRVISFDKYFVRDREEEEQLRKDKEIHEKNQNKEIQDHEVKEMSLQKV